MGYFSSAIFIVAAVLIVILFVKLLTTPFRFLIKLLLNTIFGFVLLIALNYFGAYIGISLGINWINALVVGVLGIPGLALLLLLKWLAGI